MASIPAVVAGVEEIVLCTPANKQGQIQPLILAVAAPYVDKVFRVGGAQAIAAMAYGTETVPKCDVIVGPGNKYVNIAKRLVYGEVGIDMLAGPSEVAIVADEHANPAFVAADLLAQTEHGPDNKGVLFCSSSVVLEQCRIELHKQREQLSRQEILEASGKNLIFVKTNSVAESLDLCNTLAPEHLELMVQEPLAVLPLVKNAGAVLLGGHTSASIGDYWAGPSHTLPTAGAARFSSPRQRRHVYEAHQRHLLFSRRPPPRPPRMSPASPRRRASTPTRGRRGCGSRNPSELASQLTSPCGRG